jgi:hypothetical protein
MCSPLGLDLAQVYLPGQFEGADRHVGLAPGWQVPEHIDDQVGVGRTRGDELAHAWHLRDLPGLIFVVSNAISAVQG